MELVMTLSASVLAILSTGIVDWRIILPPDGAARIRFVFLGLAVALLLFAYAL